MHAPRVIVDDRERAGGLAEELARVLGAGAVQVRRLALGDALVNDRFLVERKTVIDFVASRQDGRLTDQLARLAASEGRGGPRGVVILEGGLTDAARLGLDPERLRAWVAEAALAWRLPLLQSADAAQTARWIAALARQEEIGLNASNPATWHAPEKRPLGRGGHPAAARTPANAPARSPLALQVGALARVTGMGPVRARALIERFGGMHGLKAATPAQWRETPGIGPALAEALARFFQER